MRTFFIGCSELSAIDIRTNKVSLFNLFDHIAVVTAPVIVSDVCIMLIVDRNDDEPNTFEGSIRAKQSEKTLFTFPVHLEFEGSNRARNITTVENMLIPELSNVVIEFICEDKIQAAWTITVYHTGEPTQVFNKSSPQTKPPRKRKTKARSKAD